MNKKIGHKQAAMLLIRVSLFILANIGIALRDAMKKTNKKPNCMIRNRTQEIRHLDI